MQNNVCMRVCECDQLVFGWNPQYLHLNHLPTKAYQSDAHETTRIRREKNNSETFVE